MKHIAFLFSPLLLAGTAFAAGVPQRADHAHVQHTVDAKPTQADAFARLDANKDDALSKAELARHPMAGHMAMVDADRNGVLNRGEFAMLEKM